MAQLIATESSVTPLGNTAQAKEETEQGQIKKVSHKTVQLEIQRGKEQWLIALRLSLWWD